MTRPRDQYDDERWTGIVDAMAVGDAVEAADVAYVRAHADEPEALAEERIWGAVAKLADAPLDPEVDDDVLIDRVIQGVRPTPADDDAARRFTLVAGGLAAAVAVAAGVVLWIGFQAGPTGVAAPEVESVAAAPVAPAEEPGTVVDSGVLLAAAELLQTGDAVTLERWMEVQSERACIATRAGTVCSTQGSRLRLHEGEGIELERGSAKVVASGQGGMFADTPEGRIRTGGGAFALEVSGEPRVVTVITLVAPVMVEDPVAGEHELSQGATWVMGVEEAEPVPEKEERVAARAAVPSAEELLERAQGLFAAQNHKAAAAAYRKLIATYPNSLQAEPALVTLANLELRHLGRPAASLRHYDRYLKKGGHLAEEALAGRIEALERLGRKRAETAAIGLFLARYPKSPHAPRLRARQRELADR